MTTTHKNNNNLVTLKPKKINNKRKLVRTTVTVKGNKRAQISRNTGNKKPYVQRSRISKSPPISYENAKRFQVYNMRTKSDGTEMYLQGHDYVGQVAFPASSFLTPGSVLATYNFNPTLFNDTRLQQFANLFEKWEYTEVTMSFNPSGGSSQTGLVIGSFDYDVNDAQLSDLNENLRQAWSHMRTVETPLMKPCNWIAKRSDDKGRSGDYFCNPNLITTNPQDPGLKFYIPMVFRMFTSVAPNPVPITYPFAFGDLFFRFKIKFYMPQLEVTSGLSGHNSSIPTNTVQPVIDLMGRMSSNPDFKNNLPLLATASIVYSGVTIPAFSSPRLNGGACFVIDSYQVATNTLGFQGLTNFIFIGTNMYLLASLGSRDTSVFGAYNENIRIAWTTFGLVPENDYGLSYFAYNSTTNPVEGTTFVSNITRVRVTDTQDQTFFADFKNLKATKRDFILVSNCFGLRSFSGFEDLDEYLVSCEKLVFEQQRGSSAPSTRRLSSQLSNLNL